MGKKPISFNRILLLVGTALLLAACNSTPDGGQPASVAQTAATATSPAATPTIASVPPTATSAPLIAKAAPPTNTALLPTATAVVPPTDTAVPPTAVPPTATAVPPTVAPPTRTPRPKPTSTPHPKPTRTPLPPTHAPVPPTQTAMPPTETPVQAAAPKGYHSSLGNRGPAPELHSDTWINSGPVSITSLRGKVVIVEFWTFECINCIHALPGLKAVYNKYHSQGLEVIGAHSPEFATERDINNVRVAVADAGIPWPVPIDNDFKNWNAYRNGYWPAFYVIDKTGTIRSVRVGEGNDAGLMSDVGDLLQEQY